MRRALFRNLTPLFYWAVVVYYLRRASPIYMDGSGPMPSFYWWYLPSPDYGAYVANKLQYDCIYALPYALVGLLLVMAGLVAAPALSDRFAKAGLSGPAGVGVITFALLLGLGLVSDAGALLRLWSSPTFFLAGGIDSHRLASLAEVTLPATIMSGAVEHLRRKLRYSNAE